MLIYRGMMSIFNYSFTFTLSVSGMGKKTVILILFYLTLGLLTSLFAQSTSKLEKKKQLLLQEIKRANAELERTAKNKQVSIQKIDKISGKISLRNELIENYQTEVSQLDNEINVNTIRKKELESKLDKLKSDYARMVYMAYKYRSNTDRLLFVFAASDMNKAYTRMNYFKQLSSFRKMVAAQIKENKQRLDTVSVQLNSAKDAKTTALNEESKQKQLLEAEKKEQELMVSKLKGKEKELRARIQKKESERVELEARIRRIIEAEIAAERKRAEEKARKEESRRKKEEEKKRLATNSGNSGSKSNPTPEPPVVKPTPVNPEPFVTSETRLISSNFEGNKGRLPWPVESGRVATPFGTRPHPYLKGVTVKNDGIDIKTAQASEVRAVFGGKISGVFPVQGYGKVVIIRHGEYLTVYSNLGEVYVAKDAGVDTKTKIGRMEKNENGEYIMNFQVRKGSATMNPQTWLAN